MPSRWDILLESKPIPLIDHLLEEVAKIIAKDLKDWPPRIDSMDLEAGEKFAPLFEPDRRPPGDAVYREAFRLTAWELQRELDAYDDYMRNNRWLEHGLSPDDKLALLFINRWLLEQMLSLGESTDGRVNRQRMLDCLQRLERRLAALRGTGVS
jgi:hypothetical protein